jgi:hypothetical protein
MNDPDEFLPDELLDDLLAPLRAVSVPDEARAANREAVRHALALRARPPWWRRTVAVPVPVAIAATVTLALAVAALLWPSWGPTRVDREATRPMQHQFIQTDAPAIGDRDDLAGPAWSVTRSYIQSLESLANARVPLDSHVKEKRDDS